MAKTKNPIPISGSKGFAMAVMPDRDHLQAAIADNGNCHPSKCWHKVAIFAILLAWFPEARANDVKLDAGHIKLNYRGWRYIADTPRHVKRSLMLFDVGLYDQVHVREYMLRFRRTTKIVAASAAKRKEFSDRYFARRDAGWTPPVSGTPNLRKRVAGFSSIV